MLSIKTKKNQDKLMKINSENNTDSKLKIENKFLKDKVKTLEQTIEDKNEIINLLKGK